jgi:hypothetical protein
VLRFHRLPLVLLWPLALHGQPAPAASPASAQELVERALANELRAAEDISHPMRYKLRKTTPRLTTVKELVETRDGLVARLISVDGEPLSASEENKEQQRLDALLRDPGRQRHRKQSEDEDAERALKVLRSLPTAFVYQPAPDPDSAPQPGAIVKYTFRPNPAFSPPDLETQALTAMAGEIWIDRAQERVTRLEGRLQRDVDFGWGILGRLNKGGWIEIAQAQVNSDGWRTVHFQMQMSGRVFFKTKVFDTEEQESDFVPVPVGIGYEKGIELLRAGGASPAPAENR